MRKKSATRRREQWIKSAALGGGIWVNRVCPPLTHFLQNRAINQYLDRIATVAGQISPRAVAP